MPQAHVNVVNGGGGFSTEYFPPSVGTEHRGTIRLQVASRQGAHLTGAGMAAVLGVFNAYLTSTKCTALINRAGASCTVASHVTQDEAWLDILPEDAATVSNNLAGVLNVLANVSFTK